MCLSCGCEEPLNSHDDPRNITLKTLASAANAASITPSQAAKNILATLSITPASATKSALSTPSPTTDSNLFLDFQLLKSASERQYTLGLAYPAMKADVHRAGDGHRDFIAHDKLEESAWRWMKDHREINLFHKDGTSGHGVVVESYIYRGPDWEISSPVDNTSYVIKSGDWLLGALWDSYGWALVKSGLLNGWSPEGTAIRSTPNKNRLAQLRS